MNPIPSSTAFTESPRPVARAPLPEIQDRKRTSLLKQVLQPIASLRLTVVLFLLAIFLVFCGTLAQMNASNWTVINEYFRSWKLVWIPWQLFVQFGQIFFGVDKDAQYAGSFPFPAGGIIGGLLLLNLLAAHIVRFKLGWARAGILIIHAGLVVLMLGELVTWHFAVEGNMTIDANSSSNFLEHREFSELAITDSSAPKEDEVVAVPEGLLRQGSGRIKDERLPFEMEVVRYMVNSSIASAKQAAAGQANPATAGVGLRTMAIERPEGAGVETEAKVNLPSAYVTFYKKGTNESLGTYLVSLWLTYAEESPQQVTLDGKQYTVALRFKRTYKPYTIYLREFHHEVYPGTDKPKDFSSYIRLVDPSRKEERETRIWMNHPLYYAGETFYQQGFLPGDTGTILQVVRNPAEDFSLPHIACAMVAGGLLVHFGIKLLLFLTAMARQRGLPIGSGANAGAALRPPSVSIWAAVQVLLGFSKKHPRAGMTPPANWMVPLAVVAIAGLVLVWAMLPPRYNNNDFNLEEAANLPVLDGGRIKPLDTVARTNLMVISGRQEYTDSNGRTQPAIRWAMDVMTSRLTRDSNGAAENHKVFRIENDDVRNLLDLPRRSGYRYALSEFSEHMEKIREAANRARKRDKKNQDLFDVKIMELAGHITTYVGLAEMETLRVVPPPPGANKDDWQQFDVAARRLKAGDRSNPATLPVLKLFLAYARDDVPQFNQGVTEYRTLLNHEVPVSANMASLEVFYNNFAPFYWCCALYVLAFILAGVSWLGVGEPLRRAAFWLILLTLAVHTAALLTRMYLQGRPPVTNLYSSAVFIGWGSIVLGVVLESIFRLGIGSAVGAALGFATGLISHHLATGGDSLEMMQAVLDTNFWLATHVVAVTTGYTAAFLAGQLGMIYLIVYTVTKLINPTGQAGLQVQVPTDGMKVDALRVIGQMTYGILCFAVLFSFTGTVLGGIWADESWGRFWGWDPKENGALLIVIWSALILHARWAGLIKPFGMAALAILGNMITSFSWFGTNQLGVGLHAYGFNDTLALGLRWYWISQVVFLGGVFGLLGLAMLLHRPRQRPMAAA